MRRTVRVFNDIAPERRLGRAIGTLPPTAHRALTIVADREDLPLVAGSWGSDEPDGAGGCLVANVVRSLAADAAAEQTLDVRVLSLIPELSSRDLNRLIVAWDEAAAALGRCDDARLRRLLRDGLALATAADADDPRARGAAGDGGRGRVPATAGTVAAGG